MRLAVVLLLSAAFVSAAAGALASHRGSAALEIGFLLLAIDVQPNHLRISEGLRVSNSGPPATSSVIVTLPQAAAYVTFHRGLRAPRETPEGFSETLRFPTGITEIAYSYALPVGHDAVLSRVFPFPVRRGEIVIRGAGIRVVVRNGAALPPLRMGGESLVRWEVRDVNAGSPIVMTLRGLPARRAWIPAAAAAVLAAVLAAGLFVSLRRRTAASQ